MYKRQGLDPKGTILSRDTSGAGYSYLTFDGKLEQQQSQIESLFDTLYTILRLPPVAFGLFPGRGESGVARDRLMYSALAQISRLRLDIEQFLPELLDALPGSVAGDTTVQWPAHPLSTFNERVQIALPLYQAGLISQAESRQMLGFTGAMPEPAQMQPAQQNGAQQMPDAIVSV